jgi:hypothetical protein
MGKYEATCDSYGFQGRYWSKGETVETSTVPPKHFKRTDIEAINGESESKDIASNELSDLSVKDLKALADERGIDYPLVIKKADLIALIEKGSGE